ncbi:hypothetical protein KX729_25455 [Rhizobium sp. XQZ8]|uniref:hypothetical protein n=1 Tax=Rhizobium populisoli TaxID=2859785 RepID=UPI001CA58367|nr:hypothetical protein [Rhizobium populisoli]MBW6424803.1 hypothetical protein [Rhizobium populisoli]
MNRNSVEIIVRNGRWIVRIVERGELYEEDFGIEEGARAWASGQILRLKMKAAPGDEVAYPGLESLFRRNTETCQADPA